jgi:hypothetical protein
MLGSSSFRWVNLRNKISWTKRKLNSETPGVKDMSFLPLAECLGVWCCFIFMVWGFCCLLVYVSTRVWIQSLFYFSYFSDTVFCFCPCPASDHNLPTYSSWVAEPQVCIPAPGLLRWGLANFLPRMASNHDPPNLYLPSNWDNRSEQLWPAWWWCHYRDNTLREIDLVGKEHQLLGNLIHC